MVTLKTADRLVGLIVVGILIVGSYSWLRATRRSLQQRGMMGTMPGADPIWYLFGTLIAACVVLGTYVISREALGNMLSAAASAGAATENDRKEPGTVSDQKNRSSDSSNEEAVTNDDASKGADALAFLPEDERRVVKPILDSPGLTQVELRGRSGFSKAKVSQTVSELEDRGLIYREKQGRTYRVYPGELLKEHRHSS